MSRGTPLHGSGPSEPLDSVMESMLRAMPFLADAACHSVDPEVFYPEKGHSAYPAKAICATCPVDNLCLEYALENNERHGVWGGTSPNDRRRMKRATA